jgi:hypothetical protein
MHSFGKGENALCKFLRRWTCPSCSMSLPNNADPTPIFDFMLLILSSRSLAVKWVPMRKWSDASPGTPATMSVRARSSAQPCRGYLKLLEESRCAFFRKRSNKNDRCHLLRPAIPNSAICDVLSQLLSSEISGVPPQRYMYRSRRFLIRLFSLNCR